MTTININEKTKAGKTLLELAKILSINNKGVSIEIGVGEKVANKVVSAKQKKLITILKKVKNNAASGNFKTQTVQSFLNEL